MEPFPPLPWYRIAAVPAMFATLLTLNWLQPNPRIAATLIGGGFFAVYGCLQDQISVRLCPEYFTVLHHPILGLTNPTLLGIAWGVMAAAGGGMVLGFIAGCVATFGPKPPLQLNELLLPMTLTMLAIGVATALTGISVHTAAGNLGVQFAPWMEQFVPVDRHRGLITVASYHLTSYLVSVVASIALCVWIGRERDRRARQLS